MLRSLVNLNPIAELQQVADMMDRAFAEARANQNEVEGQIKGGWNLPVDIYERENSLVIKAAVPGIRPEDLNVSIENNILTISGEIEDESVSSDKIYRREYRYGAFSRSLRLPENIDTEGVSAEFDHGFVKVVLPRILPQKPQALRVPVKQIGELTSRNESSEKAPKPDKTKSEAHVSKN
jgi:HSP20 family protein